MRRSGGIDGTALCRQFAGAHQRREAQSLEIHRRVAERLRVDPERVLGKAAGNFERWLRSRGPVPVLLEWQRLVDELTAGELAELLVGTDERSLRLRQSSPFAGVLTPAEIWEIKRRHATA